MLDLPLLVPAIRLDRDDGTEQATALRRAKQPWVAGFILFGGEAEQVATLTRRLREEAGRHLFVASDMERGAGQQIQGLTRLPDAGIVGIAGAPWDAFQLGQLTAGEAREVGIDVVFAPCADVRSALDNPILGNRAFGFDPSRVGDLAAACADGIEAGGGLAVVKHFPGHGATTQDSHDALPVVHAAVGELERRDVLPFAKVLATTACAGLMTAHVAYPAMDASGTIATFSPAILDRARRLAGEREVVVFTDALLMAGAAVEGGEPEAARRALQAGCDALLYPDDPEALAATLDVPAAQLEAAAARLDRFTARAARPSALPLARGALQDRARRVAFSALETVRDFATTPGVHAVIAIDDDDIEDRGAVLRARAAEHRLPCELVRLPRGERPAALPVEGIASDDVDRALVVFASARAWKGCAGVSPLCREVVEATIDRLEARGENVSVLWLTPRPENAVDAHLPGSGPQLEEAIAHRLIAGLEPPSWDLLS